MGVGRHWKDISLRMFWHVIGRRAGGTDICLNSAALLNAVNTRPKEEISTYTRPAQRSAVKVGGGSRAKNTFLEKHKNE